MAIPANSFRPVNPYGQLVAKELQRLGGQVSVITRSNIARGSLSEGSFGSVSDPGKDQQAFARVGQPTSVAHIFLGTIELLDISVPDAPVAYQDLTPCYVFPLPPTPDPNPGDYILGRFAGQMVIGGVGMDLIAYC
jgi:hypothetical protein